MVNLKVIKEFKPCSDRLDNYIKFYEKKEFTFRQFMGLKNITHKDKIWVAFRLLDKKHIGKVAGEIAKTVLHIYESKYPNDLRPRIAVEAAINGTVTGKIITEARAATYAAHAYASATYASHATYAAPEARATYEAACASEATYEAACAAAYAARSSPATKAAAITCASAADHTGKQQKLHRTILLKYLK